MDYSWSSRAVSLMAPLPESVDRFTEFIRTTLKNDRIDTLLLIVRYHYRFTSHPECTGDDPLSESDVKKILAACRESGIRLIPKMNLFGHQTEQDDAQTPSGLLRGYPDMDETPDKDRVFYCRSLCPSHPQVFSVVCDLMDELSDVFECDAFHIGCDEVFELGLCDRCRPVGNDVVFASWVNQLTDHLRSRGITPYMWGDRFLDSENTPYGTWEASANGTAPALSLLHPGTVICDWHYPPYETYPSVERFAEAGFPVYLSVFNDRKGAEAFINYAKAHDGGNILGVMATTWTPAEDFMDAMEGKIDPEDDIPEWPRKGALKVADCYRFLFEE